VKILSSEHNRIILQSFVPEALFSSYDEKDLDADEKQQKLLADLAWATVIAIGPGLGTGDTAAELLETVICNAKVPILLDADAINLLARKLDQQAFAGKNRDLQERLHRLAELLPQRTILTPHLLELSRLIGIPVENITHNLIDTVLQCSYNNNLIYVAKDARTIVSGREGRYINVSGNPGMATGGSGDVLTGMIAAFVAQGMEPFDAACLGVYIHGLSGDEAAKRKGTYSMMAGDIVDSIEKVLVSIDEDRSDFQI
jgi:NAD(P)H-hydrate epimerase